MRIALFEPDIPQNTGALMRLAACLGVGVDIIEPCGFLFNDRGFRRAGMDYLETVAFERHASWRGYLEGRGTARLVLLTVRGTVPYTNFWFREDDVLLLGRESAGVPQAVHDIVDARLTVPLRPGMRSLNVVTAAAMVLGEALRQTGGFRT
jgi:tRNA (cytidine/uridine-2'-O-)-methyltransferase